MFVYELTRMEYEDEDECIDFPYIVPSSPFDFDKHNYPVNFNNLELSRTNKNTKRGSSQSVNPKYGKEKEKKGKIFIFYKYIMILVLRRTRDF